MQATSCDLAAKYSVGYISAEYNLVLQIWQLLLDDSAGYTLSCNNLDKLLLPPSSRV